MGLNPGLPLPSSATSGRSPATLVPHLPHLYDGDDANSFSFTEAVSRLKMLILNSICDVVRSICVSSINKIGRGGPPGPGSTHRGAVEETGMKRGVISFLLLL